MQYFQGKSVYKGIVMGPVAVLKKNDYQVKRARIEDPEAEVKRVKEAVEVSKKQLGRLYDKAVREVGSDPPGVSGAVPRRRAHSSPDSGTESAHAASPSHAVISARKPDPSSAGQDRYSTYRWKVWKASDRSPVPAPG